MNKSMLRKGGRREGIFALVTVLGILLLFALNLLLTDLGLYHSLYLDTTPEGLYTLTEAMKKESSFLDSLKEEDGTPKKVRMIFCNDPDRLVADTSLRTVYFMALAFHDVYPNFEVETVNITDNPTAVSMYKATTLSKIETTDVILTTGDSYRIASATSFWTRTTEGTLYSYNGEYRLVSLLKSVTAVNNPSAYFITGHGETVYDPEDPSSEGSLSTESFYHLLRERGLNVRTLDLSEVDEIPKDCALLILNDPKSDFTYDASKLGQLSYITDTEKIDRYLVKRQGAIAVVKDYKRSLPVLESYLAEWGIVFEDALVRDPDSSLSDAENTHTKLIAAYDSDEESFAHAIYGDYIDLSSAPRVLIENAGAIRTNFGMTSSQDEPGTFMTSRTFASFLTSSDGAMTYGKNSVNGAYDAPTRRERQKHTVAAVSARMETDETTANQKFSYMFATSSVNFFSEEILGNTSFANYEIVSALVENISRVDEFASMEIGGTTLNAKNAFGGKPLISETLSTSANTEYRKDGSVLHENRAFTDGAKVTYTVIVALVPVAVLSVGIFVTVKRKFL